MAGKRSVLHVDDDPCVIEAVSKCLTSRGYDVCSLSDSKEILHELVRSRQQVVLLDADMPGEDGAQLLQQIKAYDGTILVIMLTGVLNMAAMLRYFRYGAEACFMKPLASLEPLDEAVGDAFRKIDRWWDMLRDLSQRKKAARSAALTPSPLPLQTESVPC